MFTKIFLLIFGFNTDSPSVACCAFVCSDYSLLDLHLITTLLFSFLVFRCEKQLLFNQIRLTSSFQQLNTNLFKGSLQQRMKLGHICMIKLGFPVLFLYLNVECLY